MVFNLDRYTTAVFTMFSEVGGDLSLLCPPVRGRRLPGLIDKPHHRSSSPAADDAIFCVCFQLGVFTPFPHGSSLPEREGHSLMMLSASTVRVLQSFNSTGDTVTALCCEKLRYGVRSLYTVTVVSSLFHLLMAFSGGIYREFSSEALFRFTRLRFAQFRLDNSSRTPSPTDFPNLNGILSQFRPPPLVSLVRPEKTAFTLIYGGPSPADGVRCSPTQSPSPADFSDWVELGFDLGFSVSSNDLVIALLQARQSTRTHYLPDGLRQGGVGWAEWFRDGLDTGPLHIWQKNKEQ